MQKITTLFVFLFLSSAFTFSQDVVTWDFSLEDAGNGEVNIIAKASVDEGWYMYDVNIPDGGPTPTLMEFDKITGAEVVGTFQPIDKKATVKYDEIFEMEIGTFTNSVTFAQRLRITDKEAFSVEGNIRAQACNEQTCTPPFPVDFSFDASDLPASVVSVEPRASGQSHTALDPLTSGQSRTALDPLTSAETSIPVARGNEGETGSLSDGTVQGSMATQTTVTAQDVDSELLWSPVVEELNA